MKRARGFWNSVTTIWLPRVSEKKGKGLRGRNLVLRAKEGTSRSLKEKGENEKEG